MLSIIIPTYNEEGQIARTLDALRNADQTKGLDIIVVDGGSTDNTKTIAANAGATVLSSPRKGRAAQMNYGAAHARYDVLYFLHADSIPPPAFIITILEAVAKGYGAGCFRLLFDYDHWFLKINAWFTRFDMNAVRFGDQSLFVRKEIFQRSGGFREELLMMEDQEIIHRLKRQDKFVVLDGAVTTSARKYLDNGVYRMQGIFFLIWAAYYLGFSQEKLLRLHRRLIRRHKL